MRKQKAQISCAADQRRLCFRYIDRQYNPSVSVKMFSISNKNIRMSSFKSGGNIQKKEVGSDRSVSDNQSSSVTLNELTLFSLCISADLFLSIYLSLNTATRPRGHFRQAHFYSKWSIIMIILTEDRSSRDWSSMLIQNMRNYCFSIIN